MDEEITRCQSCGMPLAADYYGSNRDGSDNEEYCVYCFKDGAFTEPKLTLNVMVEKSIGHMIHELKLDEAEARQIVESVIPKLKRWQE